MAYSAALLVGILFLGLPFALVAFKFSAIKTNRGEFLILSLVALALGAAMPPMLILTWVPAILFSVAAATRCNALYISTTWRIAFTVFPVLLFIAAPFLALWDKPLIERLFLAASQGDTEKVTNLLARGEAVDQVDHQGATALAYAARNGHLEVVQVLLDRGANPARKLRGGATAEDLAARHGHQQVASFLHRWIHNMNRPDSREGPLV